jgi:serine/threonine-protein kinase
MKQCTGVTLRDQLPSEQPASRRLLRAFAEVCVAVEFAHARGVVHRDLKPSNIMLGDYGEVYILDWGLARVFDETIPSVEPAEPEGRGDRDDAQPSALLGTPGYIAPEQLLTGGEVGRPVDVYALGSILFEILTKMPMHPRQSQAAIQSTLSSTGVLSPIARYPELPIPPELDALCTEAVATSAKARPTARQIGERVQAYLDGDRDLARRKEVAEEALANARSALDGDERAAAMRDAGRALALDPDCTGAAEIVTRLMLEPPKDPPPELQQAMRDADANNVKRHALTAIISYGAIAGFLPMAMWNGIKKWPEVMSVFGMAMILALGALLIRIKPLRSLGAMIVYALGNGLLCALMSRMAGPFTFVPALICIVTMSVMAYPQFVQRPLILIGIMLASFAVPLALEAQGLLRKTWELGDSRLISHAEALVIGGPRTMTLVIGATLATFVVAGFHAASIGRTNRRAQLQLVTQAWHLRQLLPKGPT